MLIKYYSLLSSNHAMNQHPKTIIARRQSQANPGRSQGRRKEKFFFLGKQALTNPVTVLFPPQSQSDTASSSPSHRRGLKNSTNFRNVAAFLLVNFQRHPHSFNPSPILCLSPLEPEQANPFSDPQKMEEAVL